MAEYMSLKLVSGDEVFGEVLREMNEDEGAHMIELREPHTVRLHPDQNGNMGLQLIPYVISANRTKEYSALFNMDNVMVVINDYDDSIRAKYVEAVSNIAMA